MSFRKIIKRFAEKVKEGPLSLGATGSTSSLAPAQTTHWKCFSGFRQVLGDTGNEYKPIKKAMNELGVTIDFYEDAAETQPGYTALRTELEAIFNDLNTHFAGNFLPKMTPGTINLCSAIETELDHILTKEDRRAGRQHPEVGKDSDDVMRCYQRIQGHLERLRLNTDLSLWRIVDEQASEKWLKTLVPSLSARYNSAQASGVGRRECTPGTREKVLEDLDHWRRDKSQENMLWLNGMAGTGKTTIVSSLSAMLDQSHQLGASFFCTRLLPECSNVDLILPTIAYQLAHFSRPFYHALSAALQSDPDLHTKALPTQLQGLIIDPLLKVHKALPEALVVVIDALDECEDSQAVGLFLEILAKNAPELPLKVLVSSRPEPQIRERVGAAGAKLIIHDIEASIVREDIKLYLQTELKDLSPPINDAELNALAERAGALFIYAATMVRYIRSARSASHQRERILAMLGVNKLGSSSRYDALDALYRTVLSSVFTSPELNHEGTNTTKLVLDTVICAQEPLTVPAIAGLLGLGAAGLVEDALEHLGSLLHISSTSKLVSTLHASLLDYMLDPARSEHLGCQSEDHHSRLAKWCFERIENNECQFNICRLESSYLFDEQVADLEERAQLAIPQDLCSGSLIYLWDAQTCKLFLGPLQGHTGAINSVGFSFSGAHIVSGSDDTTIRVWQAQNGKPLLDPFEGHTGSVTSVSFFPDDARIVSGSNDMTIRVWEVQTGKLLLGPLHGHTGPINSVALSPDGLCIISGSKDMTIQVRHAQTGQSILSPLAGHTASVNSVAFSPDGTRIISGSDDNSVRVWDTRTGKLPLGPLNGHTSSVRSVICSPDGMHILSGSDDQTIRIWDARTGKLVLEPLIGHAFSVNSVTFSPNGKSIISGSSDKTVRVWDARANKAGFDLLHTHTQSVNAVAFSPDGWRVVSGSSDSTIRVWDVRTGALALSPLEGHTDSVNSVAFSPDGKRIVSGSWDSTIRIWHAQTGRQVLHPLIGHRYPVNSVAFSPDGTRIVSGSNENAIRIWDAQTGVQVLDPLNGHTYSVNSVAFSPDGMYIVSGSDDYTIRVWDAQTGESLFDPLLGHRNSVSSVAFSPDGTHIVSGSYDRTVCIWDVERKKLALKPLVGHTGAVKSVGFSPDGLRIVSCSDDNLLRVWEVQSGRPLLDPFQGHTNSVNSVAFSPDGMLVVSGSHDKALQIWDADISVAGSPLGQFNPGGRFVDGSGWLLDKHRRPLFWLPPDLYDQVLVSREGDEIPIESSLKLDFQSAKLGEEWVDAYIPCLPA